MGRLDHVPRGINFWMFIAVLVGFASMEGQPQAVKILWQKCNTSTTACDVWSMNMDGSNKLNLTPNTPASLEVDVQGNLTRTKIIFSSTRAGTPDIYTMNPDGSGVARLTTAPVF